MPKEYNELWEELQERAKDPIERLINRGVKPEILEKTFKDYLQTMPAGFN